MGNSIRDTMKDNIREILGHHHSIDPIEVDANLTGNIADAAFSVLGISEEVQDRTEDF